MVKQLFPSKTVAQPIVNFDPIEDAKKRMEDEHLRQLEDAMQSTLGTTEPARPTRIPDRLFDEAVEKRKHETEERHKRERAQSLQNFAGVDPEAQKVWDEFFAEPDTPKAVKVVETKRPAPQHGKVMFQDKAIIDRIDDLPLSVRHHPVIQGMNNRDVRRAYFLSKDMKITDTAALFSHGDSRRELFADVVNKIVDMAKNSSAQKANDLVEKIIHTMKTTQMQTLLKAEKQSWFHGLFHSDEATPLDNTNAWFDDATKLIDSQLTEVGSIVTALQTRLNDLDKLYNTNKDSFEMLQVEIAAGKFFIDATEAEIATAENATDAFAATEVAYHKMSLDQFKNKIVDLEGVAQSVLTNAPQIRLMQLNIQGLGERIKTVKLVYARWKTQFTHILTSLQNLETKRIGSDPKEPIKLLEKYLSSDLADFAAIQNSLQ